MEQEAWQRLRALVADTERLGKTAIDEMKGPHAGDGCTWGAAYTLERR